MQITIGCVINFSLAISISQQCLQPMPLRPHILVRDSSIVEWTYSQYPCSALTASNLPATRAVQWAISSLRKIARIFTGHETHSALQQTRLHCILGLIYTYIISNTRQLESCVIHHWQSYIQQTSIEKQSRSRATIWSPWMGRSKALLL